MASGMNARPCARAPPRCRRRHRPCPPGSSRRDPSPRARGARRSAGRRARCRLRPANVRATGDCRRPAGGRPRAPCASRGRRACECAADCPRPAAGPACGAPIRSPPRPRVGMRSRTSGTLYSPLAGSRQCMAATSACAVGEADESRAAAAREDREAAARFAHRPFEQRIVAAGDDRRRAGVTARRRCVADFAASHASICARGNSSLPVARTCGIARWRTRS